MLKQLDDQESAGYLMAAGNQVGVCFVFFVCLVFVLFALILGVAVCILLAIVFWGCCFFFSSLQDILATRVARSGFAAFLILCMIVGNGGGVVRPRG